MKNYILCVLLASLISGCGTLPQSLVAQKTAKSIEVREANDIITLPSELRLVHVKQNKDNGYLICAEPMPDTALSDSLKNVLGVTAGTKVKVEDNLETTTTVLQLAGRTQLVLLARDFLYRTCEGGMNGWLTQDQIRDMYNLILGNITQMVAADKENAKANADTAKAMLVKSGLDSKTLALTGNEKYSVELAFLNKRFKQCITDAADEATQDKCKSELANDMKSINP